MTTCQVREQDKALASARREKFKQQSGNEWTHKVDELYRQWKDMKGQEVEDLQRLLDKLDEFIGKAQEDATKLSLKKAAEMELLRIKVAKQQKDAIIRSGIAAREVIQCLFVISLLSN